jgi:hypothetical protein
MGFSLILICRYCDAASALALALCQKRRSFATDEGQWLIEMPCEVISFCYKQSGYQWFRRQAISPHGCF